jgi:hypothetical protein
MSKRPHPSGSDRGGKKMRAKKWEQEAGRLAQWTYRRLSLLRILSNRCFHLFASHFFALKGVFPGLAVRVFARSAFSA